MTIAVAAIAAAGVELAAAVSPELTVSPVSIALAAIGAFAIWRAGSVRAWKETADARGQRLEDLEREIGALRAELSIPERIEGIIGLMSETAARQDAAAAERMTAALERIDAILSSRAEALAELIRANATLIQAGDAAVAAAAYARETLKPPEQEEL